MGLAMGGGNHKWERRCAIGVQSVCNIVEVVAVSLSSPEGAAEHASRYTLKSVGDLAL